MIYVAKLDSNSVVTEVIVADDEATLLKGWIEVGEDNIAGIGYKYVDGKFEYPELGDGVE